MATNTKTAPGPAGEEAAKPAKQAKIKSAIAHFQGTLTGMYSIYSMVEAGPVGQLFGVSAFETLVKRVRASNIYEIVQILASRVTEPWDAVHVSTTEESNSDYMHWAITFERDSSSPDEPDTVVDTYYVRCAIDPHLRRRIIIPVSDKEWEEAVQEYIEKRKAECCRRIEEERQLLLDAVGNAF